MCTTATYPGKMYQSQSFHRRKTAHTAYIWHFWSTGAFPFTQTTTVLKLPIPPQNALFTWRFFSVLSSECALHCYNRVTSRIFQHTKTLFSLSCHYLKALNSCYQLVHITNLVSLQFVSYINRICTCNTLENIAF
jgi:hypothetical protein